MREDAFMRETDIVEVRELDRPEDPELAALHALWLSRHREAAIPARADFNPGEFRTLLPNVMLVDILPPPDFYRVRLMGEVLVELYGRNMTGLSPRDYQDRRTAERLTGLSRQVVATKRPLFRAGQVHWVPGKEHRRFESCFLPLATDGVAVDMIMGAIKLG